MRVLLALSMLFASSTFAYPVTYVFTGQVDEFRLLVDNVLVGDDPTSVVVVDGIELWNGSPWLVGTYSFDTDFVDTPENPPSFADISWHFTTGGIAFDKEPGRWCGSCSFTHDASGTSSHAEWLENFTNSGPLGFTYVGFDFNFLDGEFTDGTFYLHSGGGRFGGVVEGRIDRVFVIAQVLEPATPGLFAFGLLALALGRRRVGRNAKPRVEAEAEQ